MLLSEGFVLPSKGKGLLQHTVSALARLTFYENLSIGQGTSIRYPRQRVSVLSGLNFEKNVRAFPRDKENCQSTSPYKAVVR